MLSVFVGRRCLTVEAVLPDLFRRSRRDVTVAHQELDVFFDACGDRGSAAILARDDPAVDDHDAGADSFAPCLLISDLSLEPRNLVCLPLLTRPLSIPGDGGESEGAAEDDDEKEESPDDVVGVGGRRAGHGSKPDDYSGQCPQDEDDHRPADTLGEVGIPLLDQIPFLTLKEEQDVPEDAKLGVPSPLRGPTFERSSNSPNHDFSFPRAQMSRWRIVAKAGHLCGAESSS